MVQPGNSRHPSLTYLISQFLLIAVIVILAVLTPAMYHSNTEMLVTRINNQFSAGDIAPFDIVATHTFYYHDEQATSRVEDEVLRNTPPRFYVSLLDTEQNRMTIMQKVQEKILSGIADDGRRAYIEQVLYELSEEILSNGIYSERDLQESVSLGYTEILTRKAGYSPADQNLDARSIDTLLTVDSLAEYIFSRQYLYEQMGLLEIVREYVSIVRESMTENVHYDSVATTVEQERAVNSVEPVMVRVAEGEQLIQKNSVVTEEMMKRVRAMQLIVHRYSSQQIFGRILFALIITLGSVYAFSQVFIHLKRGRQYTMLFMAGIVVTLLLTYGIIASRAALQVEFLDPLLPVFFLPLFLYVLTGKRRAGMIAAVALAGYMSLYDHATLMSFFFIIAVNFISVYFIRYVSRRIDMIAQWLLTIVSSATVLLILVMVEGLSLRNSGISIALLSANITLSYVFLAFLLPLLELLFNAPTPFRLRELSSSNSPVLLALASHAPGTHAHSLNVAEFAQAAAQAVRADEQLAYVGGLYHDIGKQEHPEYFVENQKDQNKHDELKASLSVAIIKSHVKLGVERGREAKLPQEIIDIIYQHHGTDIIQIFYHEAMKEAAGDKNSTGITAHEFSYNNEIPQTKESAIVMIADSVEAASRSVKKPSHKRYENLVRSVVNGKIERGQLAASRLTMNELELITTALIHSITAKNHIRMQYPKDITED